MNWRSPWRMKMRDTNCPNELESDFWDAEFVPIRGIGVNYFWSSVRQSAAQNEKETVPVSFWSLDIS